MSEIRVQQMEEESVVNQMRAEAKFIWSRTSELTYEQEGIEKEMLKKKKQKENI